MLATARFFYGSFTNAALASHMLNFDGTWVRATGSYTATDANAWERAQATLAYDVTDFDVTFSGHTMGDYGFGLIYAAVPTQAEGYAVVVHPAQFQGIRPGSSSSQARSDVNIASAPWQ